MTEQLPHLPLSAPIIQPITRTNDSSSPRRPYSASINETEDSGHAKRIAQKVLIIWDCFDHRDLARLSLFYFSKVNLDAGKIAVLYSVMMHRIHWIHCTQDQLTYFGNLV